MAEVINNAYQNIINPPEWFGDIEEIHNKTSKVTKAFGEVVKYIAEVKDNVSKSDYLWFSGAANFINSISLIFNVPKLIQNIHKIFTEKDTSDKIENGVNAFITVGDIIDAGASFISGLKEVGVLAASMFPWTDLVGQILFPLKFLALQSNVSDTNENYKLKEKIFTEIKTEKGENSVEKRIENLVKSINFVEKEWSDIRKPLNLSNVMDVPTERKDLPEKMKVLDRIESIRKEVLENKNQVERKAALEEGEKLMETLKTRAKTKFSTQLGTTVAKVASLIVSGILLFAAVSMPLGWVLLGATLAISITAFALEKIMLNENPLAKPSDSIVQQFLQKIRDGVFKISDAFDRAAERVSYAAKYFFNQEAAATA